MSWVGRTLQDPSGLALGHVTHVEPDGTGGLILTVHGDWGALDWLHLLGASHGGPDDAAHIFKFHANDVEETGAGALRLKPDVTRRQAA